MADNIAVTPGAGATIATDDVGGFHYQINKLAYGPLDTATLVTASVGLPVAHVGSLAVTGTFFQATQPVSIAGTVTTTGGLTDTQLRLTPVPISGTVSVGTVPVTGTFFQATQPVSGPLTDAQLRLTAVPVSGTIAVTGVATETTLAALNAKVTAVNTGAVTISAALPTGANVIGAVTGSGNFAITAAALPLPAGAAADATLTGGTAKAIARGGAKGTTVAADVTSVAVDANIQAIHTNVTNASLAVTGTFWQTTQPVSGTVAIGAGAAAIGTVGVTSLPALAAGAAVIGALTANQSVNNAQIGGVAVAVGSGVTGTGVQRVVLATDVALPTGANTIGTTTGPTLTKATQGASGYSVQQLKDAGRVIASAATVIGGVTCVTVEALLSMVTVRDGVAAAGATTVAVTASKRFRITGMVCSVRSTGAAVLSGRVALRMNPAGAVAATSPIIAIASMTQQAGAVAEGGDTCVITFPDGIEFSGTMQFGLTQACSAITGVVYASLIGFEY